MTQSVVDGAHAAAAPKLVLFDFDHVLVRGDAFAEFVRTRCRRSAWRVLAALPMLVLALPGGRRRLRGVLVRVLLLGVGAARYRELADAFGRALAHDPRRLSRDALAALRVHRHAGDRVVVATACEETLARAVLDELGLGAIELVGSRLVAARFGLRIEPSNRGVEKARRLGLHGIRPPWDVVYSGSAADLPVLAAARSAVLVNPDRATLARASARLGRRLSAVEWR
ncbi:MAG TPA: haloacid dehalogenase-like hydrolase [Dokdonella sp.]